MYRVIVDDDAAAQIDALPFAALPAFADALGALELAPEAGLPYNDDLPDGPMRVLTFGDPRHGSITYLLLPDQRQVHILVVQWLGLTRS